MKAVSRRKFSTATFGGGLLLGTPGLVACGPVPSVRPSRAIGVNCFDLFYGPLGRHYGVRSAKERIRDLADLGIPFVRFSASPFWPKEWATLYKDKGRFFGVLDEVFGHAQDFNVGLIPSVFWCLPSINYMFSEPVSAWGLSSSRTRAFMREHTELTVGRYKRSKAIWSWEFGNEFNTHADWPASIAWWPKLNPDQGTPSSRSALDLLSSAAVLDASSDFTRVVKMVDQGAVVTSGGDWPRSTALRSARKILGFDADVDTVEAIRMVTPPADDFASVHLYPDRRNNRFGRGRVSYGELMKVLDLYKRKYGQRILIGEFGVAGNGSPDLERREFSEMLDAIVMSKVDWAALWVYDFARQQPNFSVDIGGSRGYQLEMIASANRRLMSGSSMGSTKL
jgi:hypothetical protein